MQSSKANNQIQEEEEEEEIRVLSVENLQQKFLNLQQDWEAFKKSNPTPRRESQEISHESSNSSTITTLFSHSSSSTSCVENSNLMVKTLSLIDQISPRNLMSSLQSDSEVREIIRGRREAIERGSLKGRRRLFKSFEGFEDSHESHCLVLQDVHEVRSALSFEESNGENDDVLDPGEIDHVDSAVWVKRYSCSLSDERVDQRSEVFKEIEKVNNVALKSNNSWFVFGFFLCVFLVICILGRFGVFSIGETKVILVPT